MFWFRYLDFDVEIGIFISVSMLIFDFRRTEIPKKFNSNSSIFWFFQKFDFDVKLEISLSVSISPSEFRSDINLDFDFVESQNLFRWKPKNCYWHDYHSPVSSLLYYKRRSIGTRDNSVPVVKDTASNLRCLKKYNKFLQT
jgi:hypothetical protein